MVRAALVLAFVASIGASHEARAVPITDNLVAWWEFSGAGTADSSGNGRDLTLRANPNASPGTGMAPTVVAGGVGGGTALNMPGATNDSRTGGIFDGHVIRGDAFLPDAVAGPEATDLTSAAGRAVQAWVRFEAIPDNFQQTLVGKASDGAPALRNGWILWFHKNGGVQTLNFQAHTDIGGIRFDVQVSLDTGAWHQIVVTGPGNGLEMYLDGVKIGASPAGSGVFTGGTDAGLMIGGEFRSFGGVPDIRVAPVLGDMDKVALWNRALSAEEVAALYNRGAGITIGETAAAPAPSSLLLLGLGVAALGVRRRSQSAPAACRTSRSMDLTTK